MPSLKWMVPDGRPRVFGIYKRVTSIGEAGANDVVIDSESLEAHHAQVVFDGRDFSVRDVARATAAAPTYFEPVEVASTRGPLGACVDGGLFANNPTMCAYAEAQGALCPRNRQRLYDICFTYLRAATMAKGDSKSLRTTVRNQRKELRALNRKIREYNALGAADFWRERMLG